MVYKNKGNFSNKEISPAARCRNILHGRAYPYIGNNSISVTNIEYAGANVSKDFYGFKIVHISDLHNQSFGEGQSTLISFVKREHPDIIIVTGDLIDRRRTDIGVAMDFIRQAVNLAPVYYVTGNHEAKSTSYRELSGLLHNAGVHMLDNRYESIKRNESGIRLIGLPDISHFGYDTAEAKAKAKARLLHMLKGLTGGGTGSLNILLTHRPELFGLFSGHGVDIVLSGHAHGGQMRLPFIGGLYAPGQGIFPKYTSGIYRKGDMSLVLSRGLGNSLFPLRIFNPPEVVVLTLKSE
jgi:predicted MPP superfamily phosphohydrolase